MVEQHVNSNCEEVGGSPIPRNKSINRSNELGERDARDSNHTIDKKAVETRGTLLGKIGGLIGEGKPIKTKCVM